MRLAVIAAVIVGLGAGIAVAEELDQSMVTIIDTNGNVTTEPLVPVAPPAECDTPACPNADQIAPAGKQPSEARSKHSGHGP